MGIRINSKVETMHLARAALAALVAAPSCLRYHSASALQFVKQTDWIHGSTATDEFVHAYEFPNGDILMSGHSAGNPDPTDVTSSGYLVKRDHDGNTLWEKLYTHEDRPSWWQRLGGITPTEDGNLFVVGRNGPVAEGRDEWGRNGPVAEGYDCWVIKVDSDGNKLWEGTFHSNNGGSDDFCGPVKPLNDGTGDYISAGKTYNSDGVHNDGWAFRMAANGTQIWVNSYFGLGIAYEDDPGDSYEAIGPYVVVPNGNIVCSGVTYSYGGTGQVFLMEIDTTTGAEVWEKLVGNGEAVGMVQTPDDGFLLSGTSRGQGTLIKTNSAGDLEWQKYFGDPSTDLFGPLIATSDRGYATCGYTIFSNPQGTSPPTVEWSWVYKFNSTYDVEAEIKWGPIIGRWANCLGLIELSDKSLLAGRCECGLRTAIQFTNFRMPTQLPQWASMMPFRSHPEAWALVGSMPRR